MNNWALIFISVTGSLSRRKSGGIVFLVKTEIQKYVKVDSEPKSKLILKCKISSNLVGTNTDLHCGVVYIPPNGSRYASDKLFAEIQGEKYMYTAQIITKYSYLEIFILAPVRNSIKCTLTSLSVEDTISIC